MNQSTNSLNTPANPVYLDVVVFERGSVRVLTMSEVEYVSWRTQNRDKDFYPTRSFKPA